MKRIARWLLTAVILFAGAVGSEHFSLRRLIVADKVHRESQVAALHLVVLDGDGRPVEGVGVKARILRPNWPHGAWGYHYVREEVTLVTDARGRVSTKEGRTISTVVLEVRKGELGWTQAMYPQGDERIFRAGTEGGGFSARRPAFDFPSADVPAVFVVITEAQAKQDVDWYENAVAAYRGVMQ